MVISAMCEGVMIVRADGAVVEAVVFVMMSGWLEPTVRDLVTKF